MKRSTKRKKNNFLLKDLIDDLFVNRSVQLSVFPEFVSFLAGSKRIIRIVVDKPDSYFDFQLFSKYGLYVSQQLLYTEDKGNSFGRLISKIDESRTNDVTEVVMLSFSYSQSELMEFEEAEVEGDTEKAGLMLGYPKCCVKNVEKINSLNELWSLYYLEDYKLIKAANHYANRFPITWGGMSPIGELFPCSLSCTAAIQYAKNMKADLHSFGFERIASNIYEAARRSVYINTYNGKVSTVPKLYYSEINFS